VQIAFADPCPDVSAGRVSFRVDPDAPRGNVVAALAALLIRLARERRRAVGIDREHQEPVLVATEGASDE
jgi:hypothetical protein